MSLRICFTGLLVMGVACAGAPGEPASPLTRFALVDQSPRGLSGLTRGDSGRLWAVSERGRVLVSFSARGDGQSATPIDDLGDGFDLESIAYLGDGAFAVGTEGREDGRRGDDVLILRRVAGRVAVADRIAIDFDRLGLEAVANQGIEGLCAVGSTLLASVETAIVSGDRRVAAIARVDLESRSFIPITLRLTSATGKISSLDCRRGAGGLDVVAVERHFEVTRVLRFSISDDIEAGAAIEASVAADVTAIKEPGDNYEGIAWVADDVVAIILDNEYGDVTGPNALILVRLRP